MHNESTDYLIIRDASTLETVGGAIISDSIKARHVYFATNNYAILIASDTQKMISHRASQVEISGALAYSLKTKEIQILLNKTRGLLASQPGLGRIVGVDDRSNIAFMPAHSAKPPFANNLYEIDLETGKGRRYARGERSTVDWFVGKGGRLLAREDYVVKRQEHRIYSLVNGKPNLVYSEKIAVPRISISAVSDDENSLLFIDRNNPAASVQRLSLIDGTISSTSYQKPGNDVSMLLTDINRKLHAVVYSQQPFYEFQNARIQKLYRRVSATFPKSEIAYLGSTADMEKMLFQVSGNFQPHSILLLDSTKTELTLLGSGYNNIDADDLGSVELIEYAARDGLTIPAVITWPANTSDGSERRNLPLIVLPHGGPEMHDVIGFHWWAQYFANQGYLILQPNFRGSSGYGHEFMLAGRGKWGREMQDDVTDGVAHLVKQGLADANRVCIMGASYGGYSALAGGAFSPEIYRCVVAVAGVSDLPKMLRSQKQRYGSKHWLVSYWNEVIGDSSTDFQQLKKVSPASFASQFTAPVLLLHGKDDTVVPFSQSKIMHKALKKAGKDSKLVALNGEDHWLSYSKTRLQMLTEIDKFIKLHNPVDEEDLLTGP